MQALLGLARAGLMSCIVALLVTTSDLWWIRGVFSADSGGLDVPVLLELGSGIAGVHACVAFLVAPLVGLAAGCFRFRAGRWGLWGALGVSLLLLNDDLVSRKPWVGALLFAFVLALAIGSRWAASGSPLRRRWSAGGWGILGVVALVANAGVLRGTNLGQHQSLVLCAWMAGIAATWIVWPWLARGVGPRRASLAWLCVALWIAAGTYAWQISAGVSRMDARVRFMLRAATPAASPTLALFDRATDVDGDGHSVWFGGGDCSPWNAEVSPEGTESPSDGVDGNCMAGDPDVSDVARLRVALAGGDAVHRPSGARVDRILLITVDALRHDSPLPRVWDRLGGRCRAFGRAYATSHGTTDSVYSLLRSRFSSQGEFARIGDFTMPMEDPSPTLPEVLEFAGYETAAVVFHHRFDPRMKLTRGFGHVWIAKARREVIQGIAAPSTIAEALRWHDTARPPWFLWVHFYDVHAPYLEHGARPSTAREAYDGEVAFTDAKILEFLDALGDELDDTAVILTSDHGEAFGEHGTFLHANTLFEEELRVPLWVCPPGGRSETIDMPVSGIDVAPTILSWAQVTRPTTFVGRSLTGSLRSVPVHAASAIDGMAMQALIYERHKLIRHLPGDAYALFDLSEDPGERVDLTRFSPEELLRMQSLLDHFAAVLSTHPR